MDEEAEDKAAVGLTSGMEEVAEENSRAENGLITAPGVKF